MVGCSPAERVTVGPVNTRPIASLDNYFQSARVEVPKKVSSIAAAVILLPSHNFTPDFSGKWIEINLFHGKGQLQHFTAYEGKKVVYSGLVSGAMTDIDRPADQHPDEPHNHLGWFWIKEKNQHYWSKENKCPMLNALFYANGHGHAIHSCQVKDIKRLGKPASHGCTRASPEKSLKLFVWAGNVKLYPVPLHIIRSQKK